MTEKAPAAAAATRVPGLLPDSAAASHQTAILRGILLMCAGVSLFPFMNAAVKLLGARYPANEIVWARFTGHLIVMLAVFLPQYGWRLFATRRPAVQIGRGLLMLIGNALFVIAIASVPLATASAIGFTAPLIVTALAVPLLREHVGIRRWSAVLIGFAGALIVIRPGAGFPGGVFSDPMLLLLLLGSATHALYLIATRWIGRYDDPATSIVYSALMGSLIMSLVLPFSFVWPRDRVRSRDARQSRADRRRRALSRDPRLPARPGGGHRAAELCRAGRHRFARLSDLRQFPGYVDLGRGGDHHRLGALHRAARAPPARPPRATRR